MTGFDLSRGAGDGSRLPVVQDAGLAEWCTEDVGGQTLKVGLDDSARKDGEAQLIPTLPVLVVRHS